MIDELLHSDDLDLLRLQLNRTDEPAGITRERDGRRVLLRIPAELLREGENTLSIGLSSDAEQPLEVDGVLFGQSRTGVRQKIDLTTRHPAPAPALKLIGHDRSDARSGCWQVLPDGYLVFRLYLHTVDKVIVAVEMPRSATFPASRLRERRQRKLLQEVGKRVEGQLKKWIDECAARREEGALDDLRAYRELYQRQLRLALEGDESLQTIIDRTGNPDAIVSASSPPIPLTPEVVKLVKAQVARRVTPRATPPAPAPVKSAAKAAGAKAGTSFAGKLVLTLLFAGVSAGAYAAWKYDGVNWLRQKWSSLTAPAGARGDVLTALRDSGRDLNWTAEVCQEIPRDKLQALLANFAGQLGPHTAPDLDKVKSYMLGDRKNPMGEALLGIPVCDNMLVVHDFSDADALRRHFEKIPQQFRDGLQRFGTEGEPQEVSIPHCDAALRLTTRLGNIVQHQTMARSGRFCLMTTSPDMSNSEEQTRRLTALAKRLHEHFGR